jgi:hypothetical protein
MLQMVRVLVQRLGLLAVGLAFGGCGSSEHSNRDASMGAAGASMAGMAGMAGAGGNAGIAGAPAAGAGSTSVAPPFGAAVVLAGQTMSDDFPASPNATQPARNQGGDGMQYDATVTLLSQASDGRHRVEFATYLGGSALDGTYAGTLDRDGNVFVTGVTESPDFPTTNALQTTHAGKEDCFVAKFARDGSLSFATYLGGSDYEAPRAIAVDATGIYVLGSTTSPDFPTTPGVFQPSYGGHHEGFATFGAGGDIFVTKLALDGSSMVWSTFVGGSYFEKGAALLIGPDSSVYVTGATESANFPTTPGAFQTTISGMLSSDDGLFGNTDAFVFKLSPDGSKLDLSTLLGGDSLDGGSAVAVLADGSLLLGATVTSSDFPQLTAIVPGDQAGVVAHVSADLTSLLGVHPIVTTDETWISHLLVSGSDVLLGGTTTSTQGFATPGVYQSTPAGEADAFIAQLSPDFETLRRFTYLGGSSYDSPVATGVDAAGRIHVVLSSTSSMLPLRGDGAPYAGTGTGTDVDRDFYWAALSPELATLDFATYFGSSGDDVCWSAAVRGMALP